MGPDSARQIIFDIEIKKRAFMSNQTNADNTYAEGAIVIAKTNPALPLKIMKYYQRIYYCAVVGDDARKLLVYFDRELMSPNPSEDNLINP